MPQWRIKIEVFKIVEAMKMLSKYSKDFSATPEARYFYISWLVIYNQQTEA